MIRYFRDKTTGVFLGGFDLPLDENGVEIEPENSAEINPKNLPDDARQVWDKTLKKWGEYVPEKFVNDARRLVRKLKDKGIITESEAVEIEG
jgi:hypothetical protein